MWHERIWTTIQENLQVFKNIFTDCKGSTVTSVAHSITRHIYSQYRDGWIRFKQPTLISLLLLPGKFIHFVIIFHRWKWNIKYIIFPYWYPFFLCMLTFCISASCYRHSSCYMVFVSSLATTLSNLFSLYLLCNTWDILDSIQDLNRDYCIMNNEV